MPAAMLRSPSSLRSLLRLSGRLLRAPNPPRLPRPLTSRLPNFPLSARPRFLSSSSSSPSPAPGGVRWATYDPLTDTLSSSPALHPPSASDSEAPPETEWGVFDPVAGRIVTQDSPPASSSATAVPPAAAPVEREEEKEGAGESEDDEKGKVLRASARGAKAPTMTKWSTVAAARKSPGKGGKEKQVSYACSNCGEGHGQWWGTCRYCSAMGTVVKFVPGPDGDASAEGSQSHHVGRSWIPQKSKEMVPQSLQEVNKGINQAEWRIPL